MSGALQAVFQNQRSFAPPLDAQFNYVTMLLHGDGTNGAQNNTFLDSSTNNFAITSNGGTTQGSFSPYGSNWSNYFDGSGDYLTVPYTTALQFPSDFTVECWVNLNLKVTNYPTIVANYSTFTSNGGFAIFASHNSGTSGKYNIAFNGVFPVINSTTSISYGTWQHIALVRSGSTLTLYVDGVANGTSTQTATVTGTANNWWIGTAGDDLANGYLNGFVSNFRAVKGTAVYTSNFTPSTAPLTAISGTQLLTCQSNRFIDNSTNNFAITKFGDTSVQRFNPFGASTAYSTSVIGGSGFFDGAGDYLTVTEQTYSGNFTIECWFYQTAASGSYAILFASANASVQIMVDYQGDGKLTFYANNSSIQSASGVFQRNQWNHLAYVRSGTTLTIYYNGTSVASGSRDGSIPIRFLCGYSSDSNVLNGYTSDVRITTSAVYTTTFTPPTAPLTAISGTSILLNMTNGAIFDSAMMNDLQTAGSAQLSTSVVKYGTASMYFISASNSSLLTPVSGLATRLGSGNFTIEAWIYPTAVDGSRAIIDYRLTGADANGFFFGLNQNRLQIYSQGVINTTVGTISINAWSHVACVRSSGTITIYINGVSAGSVANTTNWTNNTASIGGSTRGSTEFFSGYMDEFRITDGYARYTANFTPPTEAFPNIGPT